MSEFTVPCSSVWPNVLEQIPKDVFLFPHQVDSIRWLIEREKENKNSLIGDIMGLGKTMTTVTLLSINKLNRTLIVCSKSLLCQWARELISQKHKVYSLESSFANRVSILDNKVIFRKAKIAFDNLPENFVAITTYGRVKPFPEPKHELEKSVSAIDCANTVRHDKTLIPFNKIIWDRIVVDEIHNLRNGISLRGDNTAQLRKKSLKFYRMLRLKKNNYTSIIGLTGTPIQNRIGDLASVFLFLGIGNISKMTTKEDLIALIGENMFRRNADNLTDITKALIGFPTEPYNNVKVIVEYETEEEKNFYMAAVGELTEKLKLVLSGYKDLVSEDNILVLLTMLRLLSSHPMAYINCYNKRYKADMPEWEGTVSKYNMIEKQLRNYHEDGESCIVFVHFYEEAARIAKLDIGYENVEFMNGTVDITDRDFIVNDSKAMIQKGETYLIIANLLTCSEGLNLAHFHNIVLLSVDWAPFAEEQAIARVYRVGSTRKVNVTRYYHKEIEEIRDNINIDKYMVDKQDAKRKIVEEMINNTPNAAWNYSITNIPVLNEPCTKFPPISHSAPPKTKKKQPITKQPVKRVKKESLEERRTRERKERLEATMKRLDSI